MSTGTNENAILSILGRRTTYERMAIRDAYPSISSKVCLKDTSSYLLEILRFVLFCARYTFNIKNSDII